MATGMRAAPTSPIGHPDILWGLPGQGGLLTEWAETVPDLTWPESIRTYGRMRRDPRITAILQAYTLPILRATWAVDPAGVDRAEAVDLVAANLGLPVLGEKGEAKASPVRGFTWHDHLRLALLSLVYGHMPFEQWYEQRDGRTQLAGLQERQPHTVNIIDIDQQGYVSQVWQNTQDKPIPANRLVWYAREREGANYTGVSLLRACYTPWVLKHESMRVHATSIRRFGMGIPVVKAPPGATPSQVTEAQRLAAGMRAGDQAGAGLPSGFDFNLAGMSGSAPDAIGFLNYCDQQMTGSALAQVVELASSTYGSRAVGATFLDLFLLALQAVADQIGATISQGDPAMPGVARSLVEYNWGEGEPVPRVVAADVGDRHELTAEAVQALVASGSVHPDEDLEAFIRDAWSLPPRNPATQFPPPPPKSGPGRPPPAGPGEPGGGGGPPPAAPAPAAPGGPAPAPGGGNMFGPVAAAGPGGLRRHLTPVEAASGLDPVAIRDDIDSAARRVLAAWAPVVAAQRNELADQVTAAVDDGQLARLAQLTAPAGDGPGLLHRAMSAVAQRAAARAIGEAAAQGVDIDPAAVTVDEDRLRQLAAARAAMAGQALAQAASRKALQVVTASAGTQAARHVTAELAGLSTTPLADQLLAAMGAASNEGRFAVMDAGPEAAYTATEIMDANTCARCAEVDGHVFASLADARAAYPAGAYHECLGALRCRGTVVASWPDVAPPGRPPFGEAQAAYDLGGGAWTDDRGVAAAYDPAQPRDKEGRWLGGALKQLGVRKQIGYHGHTIDSTAGKGYRVRLKGGEVRHYQDAEDAAKAARDGRHHGGQAPAKKPAKGGEVDYSPLLDRDFDYGKIGTGGAQDKALAALARLAGFDGPPAVTDDAGIDRRVAAGERELFRGFNGINGGKEDQTRRYADQFLHGEYFAGVGTYGNGTYVSHEDTAALVARVERDYASVPRDESGQPAESWVRDMYARDLERARNYARDRAASYATSHGTVVRMTLDAQARTITWDDLTAKWKERYLALQAAAGQSERGRRELDLLKDPGRFATALGYDAVTDITPGELLILNRTALHASSRLHDTGVR